MNKIDWLIQMTDLSDKINDKKTLLQLLHDEEKRSQNEIDTILSRINELMIERNYRMKQLDQLSADFAWLNFLHYTRTGKFLDN